MEDPEAQFWRRWHEALVQIIDEQMKEFRSTKEHDLEKLISNMDKLKNMYQRRHQNDQS